MHEAAVTEEEIEAAEKLRRQGEFTTALGLAKDMLSRAHGDEIRMRLLYDVIFCSTALCMHDVTDDAISELEKLPEPAMSRVLVDFIKAMSFIEFGKAQEALDLIEANLNSEFMERDDFRNWKYEHLVYKGRSLTRLARCDEALCALDEAHAICPNGKYETDILIARSNCLTALDRYEEAYKAASQVLNLNDEEMATLAMQYMAECRMLQGKVRESLELYRDLLKKLPCRLVQEERIQAGIKNGIAYLEKRRPQGKPS